MQFIYLALIGMALTACTVGVFCSRGNILIKLIVNCVLGAAALMGINYCTGGLIAVNAISVITTGCLGAGGVVLLLFFSIFL